jgi:hypothetical protein
LISRIPAGSQATVLVVFLTWEAEIETLSQQKKAGCGGTCVIPLIAGSIK